MFGKKWEAPSRPVRDLLRMMTAGHAPTGELRMNSRSPKQSWLKRLRARWNAALDALIPMGYEDKAGFHYGSKPAVGFHSQNHHLAAE